MASQGNLEGGGLLIEKVEVAGSKKNMKKRKQNLSRASHVCTRYPLGPPLHWPPSMLVAISAFWGVASAQPIDHAFNLLAGFACRLCPRTGQPLPAQKGERTTVLE